MAEHGGLKRVVLIVFGLCSVVTTKSIAMEAPNKPCEKLKMLRAVTALYIRQFSLTCVRNGYFHSLLQKSVLALASSALYYFHPEMRMLVANTTLKSKSGLQSAFGDKITTRG